MELLKEMKEMRIESEPEAIRLIESYKSDYEGKARINYKTTYKEKKQKGEVVDYWWVVQIVIDYTKQ